MPLLPVFVKLSIVQSALRDYARHNCQTTALFDANGKGWIGDKYFWVAVLPRVQHQSKTTTPQS